MTEDKDNMGVETTMAKARYFGYCSLTRKVVQHMENKLLPVDIVKWIATVIQLIGYGMTGLNLVPYNIYMFFIGIFLWFAVGFMWKDKAIMVVHIGAFLSLFIGYTPSHVKSEIMS